MNYDPKQKGAATVNLWEHYDKVCLAARRLVIIGEGLGITSAVDENSMVDFIMKMADNGDGMFAIPDVTMPSFRTAGLVRIQFEWSAMDMAVVPLFFFTLAPGLDL
jgi:hypothetical protein